MCVYIHKYVNATCLVCVMLLICLFSGPCFFGEFQYEYFITSFSPFLSCLQCVPPPTFLIINYSYRYTHIRILSLEKTNSLAAAIKLPVTLHLAVGPWML